ncbi:monosaccharide ABC transporter membrane protein (CUT2 family) [Hydrogenispora ethanolica]|jgi:simple sugar transport system permease protein|uniref:Monosaccharide ABC transporter membrane protein (CUT2 family) n=1 Tax=Hydrogenispora ethanolica TaxID=1082276 RepID=A0A4R1S289_HYDET|nr:ABC transporter permease [Hydrogenispora ethanolica]TCL73286.1 monosaccharide ABC transporter membrane protein (CUT2 family) [Hydrogenispora ethanolica]
MKMKKLFSSNEFYVALTIIGLSLLIGSVNKAFFTAGNMIDLARGSIVMAIFALGTLMVIISGGIDVSFPAIASFSMYVTTKVLTSCNFQGSVWVAFAMAGAIGLVLGLINATFISFFKLPTLIVTLGTASMFSGFMLAFIGVRELSILPPSMVDFSKLNLFEITSKDHFVYGLPAAVLIVVALALLVWFILKYTMIGRGIYALGGDRVAAERAGFNIHAILFFIYSFVGFISGIAGLVHTSLMRNSNPVTLIGTELTVIAAVVLGGARISGGHGTVLGSILGLLLVTIMTNSLILLGVPSYWQRVVIGLLIVIGTGITAQKRSPKRAGAESGC